MRMTKDMMLQSQKNTIHLATDSLRFGEEIRNKNLYGAENQTKSAHMVFKRENSDALSLILETLIQLLENLRFHQSSTNITVQQRVWQQEIVRQIKNQINIYQQYHISGNLRHIFQQFQNDPVFENAEILTQTIENIRQELKKNADAIIQERTPIFNRIGHTLFSVSAQNIKQKSHVTYDHTNMMQSIHQNSTAIFQNKNLVSRIYPVQMLSYMRKNVMFRTNWQTWQERIFHNTYTSNQYTNSMQSMHKANMAFFQNKNIVSRIYPIQMLSHMRKNVMFRTELQLWLEHMIYQTFLKKNIFISKEEFRDTHNIKYNIFQNTINVSDRLYAFFRKQAASYQMIQTDVQTLLQLQHMTNQNIEQAMSNLWTPWTASSVFMHHIDHTIQSHFNLFQQYPFWYSQQNVQKIDTIDIKKDIYQYPYDRLEQTIQHQYNKIQLAFYHTDILHLAQQKDLLLQEMQKQYLAYDFLMSQNQKRYDVNVVQWYQNVLIQNQTQQRNIKNFIHNVRQYMILQNNFIRKLQETDFFQNLMFAQASMQPTTKAQYMTWQKMQSIYPKAQTLMKKQEFLQCINRKQNFIVFSVQQKIQNSHLVSKFQQYMAPLFQNMQYLFTSQIAIDPIHQNFNWQIFGLQKKFLFPHSIKEIWQTVHIMQKILQKQRQVLSIQSNHIPYEKVLEKLRNNTKHTKPIYDTQIQFPSAIDAVQSKDSSVLWQTKQIKQLLQYAVYHDMSKHHVKPIYQKAYYDFDAMSALYEIAQESKKIYHKTIFNIKNRLQKKMQSIKQNHAKTNLFWQNMRQTVSHMQEMIFHDNRFFWQVLAKQFYDVARYHTNKVINPSYLSLTERSLYTKRFHTYPYHAYNANLHKALHLQQVQQQRVRFQPTMTMSNVMYPTIQTLMEKKRDFLLHLQNNVQVNHIFAMPQLQKNMLWHSFQQRNQKISYATIQNIWYANQAQSFVWNVENDLQQSTFSYANQALSQVHMVNIPTENMDQNAILEQDQIPKSTKEESVYATWKDRQQIKLFNLWKRMYQNTMPYFVENMIQKNMAQRNIFVFHKATSPFWSHATNQSQKERLKYHNSILRLQMLHTRTEQPVLPSKTITQQYTEMRWKANISHSMFDRIQNKNRTLSSKIKLYDVSSVEEEQKVFAIQSPIIKADAAKTTNIIEKKNAKPSIHNVGERWQRGHKADQSLQENIVFASSQNPQVWRTKESLDVTSDIQNPTTKEHLQTDFIYKKEKQSVLHNTEIQQEWEEAVTVRILEKVQELWKEQKGESVALQTPQQPQREQGQTNLPEQEAYTISALELERMYDKIYTRIERTLASERRRMGM